MDGHGADSLCAAARMFSIAVLPSTLGIYQGMSDGGLKARQPACRSMRTKSNCRAIALSNASAPSWAVS
jgi:hypothetical protein